MPKFLTDPTDKQLGNSMWTKRRVLQASSYVAGTAAISALTGNFDTALAQSKADATKFPMDDLLQLGQLADNVLGKADAPVTIIEYASMTCGHCGRFHNSTFKALKEKYIDTGKARFIFREFPGDGYALAAFMLARCLATEKYFPFIDILFAQQREWAYVEPSERFKTLFKYAKQAGFSEDEYRKCITDQKTLDGINWVRARGYNEFAVNATPTIFVNGEKLTHGQGIEDFEEIMTPILNGS